jgi:AraC family transcriptional regulator of arabinose operon
MQQPDDDAVRRVRWANRRIRSAWVVVGEILYEPGGYCGPRVQRDYQLVIMHSGGGRVVVGSQERELRPGFVQLFRPGHPEHFKFAERHQTHHSWCSIQPSFVPRDMRRQLDHSAPQVVLNDVFRHLLAAAAALPRTAEAGMEGEIDNLGLCLFGEYLRLAREAAPQWEGEEPVRRAQRFMETHFGQPDCLAQATEAAGVSRNALIYKFRASLGLTPARHLWRLRVERGIALLGESGLTISEIAYQCGFKTPYHFSRLVKQAQGHSPRQVRRLVWAGQGART